MSVYKWECRGKVCRVCITFLEQTHRMRPGRLKQSRKVSHQVQL